MEQISTTKEKVHRTEDIDKINLSKGKVVISTTETILVETYDKDDVNFENLLSEKKNFINHNYTADYLPHEDFVNAMKMLRKPVIDIMELKDYKKFDQYQILGIQLNGEKDDSKVIIIYQKHLEWCHKPSPAYATVPVPLYDQEHYSGSKQLDGFCSAIVKEAWAYMKGKHAFEPQLTLEFASGEKMDMKLTVEAGGGPADDSEESDDLPFNKME